MFTMILDCQVWDYNPKWGRTSSQVHNKVVVHHCCILNIVITSFCVPTFCLFNNCFIFFSHYVFATHSHSIKYVTVIMDYFSLPYPMKLFIHSFIYCFFCLDSTIDGFTACFCTVIGTNERVNTLDAVAC